MVQCFVGCILTKFTVVFLWAKCLLEKDVGVVDLHLALCFITVSFMLNY